MIDELELYNLIAKYPNTKDLVNVVYEQGKADGLSMAYDQIDEGVCHICEHYIEDHKCIKECNENGWERETFMKWLKEQRNENI